MEEGEGGSSRGTADEVSEKVDICGRESAEANGVRTRFQSVSRRLEMKPAASETENFRLRRQPLVFSLIQETM